MQKPFNYYQSQIDKVKNSVSEYPVKIKISTEHAATNYFSINKESAQILIEYLKTFL